MNKPNGLRDSWTSGGGDYTTGEAETTIADGAIEACLGLTFFI